MNVLIAHPMQWFFPIVEMIVRKNPDVLSTPNFEQVYAMVKNGEVSRLCIMFSSLTEPATEIVRKVHDVNPDIPIMVWNSEKPVIKRPNETYLDASDYTEKEFYNRINEFFSGTHP